MRKQYYFKQSSRGLLAWDIDRLVRLTSDFPHKQVPLSKIRELHEPWSGDGESQTWHAMIEHIKLIEQADLLYPIILSSSGAVMDGMHRVVRVVLQGKHDIEAVQFEEDPEPDYIGLGPEDLPY